MLEHSDVKEMIARLVGFPTVSRDSNLELIHFTRDYLASHGITSHLVPNDDGTKSNLFASIGPDTEGGVVLSSHTDVVPVEGQEWASDPFELVEKSNRLYGRGAADMKGFSAIALALVPEMARAGLKRPIHLAMSFDEEVGCTGAPLMIDEMVKTVPLPSAVIVGEPTLMQVVTSHKGCVNFTTKVRGHSVHSSQPHRGVSAVTTAARLIAWLDDRMRDNEKASEKNGIGELFDPPYTTIHCGIVSGGTAHNIVARDCEFITDVRPVPGDPLHRVFEEYQSHLQSAVIPAMREIAAETDVVSNIKVSVPGLRPEDNGEAEHLARALTGDNGTHVVSYGTEAGQFQDAGYSVVVCGPGSIDQAHQPDEFISNDQVAKGTEFVRRLVHRLAA